MPRALRCQLREWMRPTGGDPDSQTQVRQNLVDQLPIGSQFAGGQRARVGAFDLAVAFGRCHRVAVDAVGLKADRDRVQSNTNAKFRRPDYAALFGKTQCNLNPLKISTRNC